MPENQKTRAYRLGIQGIPSLDMCMGEVRTISREMFEPDGQRAGDAQVASGQVISQTEIGNGLMKQSLGWNRLSDEYPDPAIALISSVQEMEKNPCLKVWIRCLTVDGNTVYTSFATCSARCLTAHRWTDRSARIKTRSDARY